jgi:hypothetical protein
MLSLSPFLKLTFQASDPQCAAGFFVQIYNDDSKLDSFFVNFTGGGGGGVGFFPGTVTFQQVHGGGGGGADTKGMGKIARCIVVEIFLTKKGGGS